MKDLKQNDGYRFASIELKIYDLLQSTPFVYHQTSFKEKVDFWYQRLGLPKRRIKKMLKGEKLDVPVSVLVKITKYSNSKIQIL